ncbi:hypothetical protein HERIO_912 [Hepatospora eriocheir]|uniref:Uncharacterized protein n=1 Tax=Hepatospora eriocheir TaxID=1081669 RepID=A0A1X0QBS5_9MICR|nr:hypothetical protein HERIO_912 [Hepatospora eriocheir]
MYDINRKHIKELINKYKDNEKVAYDLEYVIERGLRYIYAELHENSKEIHPCRKKFSETILTGKPHVCDSFNILLKFNKLNHIDPKFIGFSNKNIALVVNDSNDNNQVKQKKQKNQLLCGYFMNNVVFKTKCNDITALEVTKSKIYLGTKEGVLIYYDPISSSSILDHRHNAPITSIHWIKHNLIDDYVLTSSEDGCIYLEKLIKLSDQSIQDVIRVNEDVYFFVSGENTVGIFNRGKISTFDFHKDRIINISYKNNIGVTSSADGVLGFTNLISLTYETLNIGCSHHKRISSTKLLCYGLSKVVIYDFLENKTFLSFKDAMFQCKTADFYENLLVYSFGQMLYFYDLLSKKKLNLCLDSSINEIRFSQNANFCIVCTDSETILIEIK